MKVMVTGVGGNVGQYLAERLSKNGFSVVGIYRNKKPVRYSYRLVKADLANDLLEEENVDIIIHAAARIQGGSKQLLRDNIYATERLLKYAESTGVRSFFYLSTVSVYGNSEGELSLESDILNPEVYGMTKKIAECLVEEAKIKHRIILELPRMLGPFVDLKECSGSGFLTMTRKILYNEDVLCFIPDMYYNNYMHVSELFKFIIILIQGNEGVAKYLLGAKEKLKMIEILRIMKSTINSKSQIIAGDHHVSPKCSEINIEAALAAGYAPEDSTKILSQFMLEMKRKNLI